MRTLVYILLITSTVAPSMAQELWWPTSQSEIGTEIIHNVFVQLTPQIQINDVLLTEDALIGVYYFDDFDSLKCGGYVIYSPGIPIAFPVYGDSPGTGLKDGFSIDESFQWFVELNGSNYPMEVTYTIGSEMGFIDVFGIGMLSMVTSLQINYDLELEGCTDALYLEYDSSAIIDNGSCDLYVIEGCSDINALNYSDSLNTSCVDCCEYYIPGCTVSTAINYQILANEEDNSCIYDDSYVFESMTFKQEYIPLYFPEGWVFFGFTCTESAGVVTSLESIVEKVIIVKDNNGSVYLPEFGFDGIGELIFSSGYQIKLSEQVNNFSFCPTIVMSENELEYLNYGDFTAGGIIFYIDSTGQHGLVAAIEDLDGEYEWGCNGYEVNVADSLEVGTSYQNTIEIISQGCGTENEDLTAARGTTNFISEGYSDWYLPSKNELKEMYDKIGTTANFNNDGLVIINYWSSSEHSDNSAWSVDFSNGNKNFIPKNDLLKVRAIRAF